ncbi:hypothetical protein ACFQZT_28005 [Paenibacillus sp. GCM10027628]|uniref:hypothetical protein n=1 Tax=Paenibacillus sp. GCM10027628 TaxID=3273413 RepID=UPI0036370D1E
MTLTRKNRLKVADEPQLIGLRRKNRLMTDHPADFGGSLRLKYGKTALKPLTGRLLLSFEGNTCKVSFSGEKL